MITDSLRDDWFETIMLVSDAVPEPKVLRKVSLKTDVSLKQSAQVQRFGGETRERLAIVTANIEHWPGAENYPRWLQLHRIERMEALCSALVSAWDWIVNERRDYASMTIEARHAAISIGCAPDASIQRTAERMRQAGYYRESLSPPDAIWNDPSAYPLDKFEDRQMCFICHYPIGSYEPERFALDGIHETCVHFLRRRRVTIKEPNATS